MINFDNTKLPYSDYSCCKLNKLLCVFCEIQVPHMVTGTTNQSAEHGTSTNSRHRSTASWLLDSWTDLLMPNAVSFQLWKLWDRSLYSSNLLFIRNDCKLQYSKSSRVGLRMGSYKQTNRWVLLEKKEVQLEKAEQKAESS